MTVRESPTDTPRDLAYSRNAALGCCLSSMLAGSVECPWDGETEECIPYGAGTHSW